MTLLVASSASPVIQKLSVIIKATEATVFHTEDAVGHEVGFIFKKKEKCHVYLQLHCHCDKGLKDL